MKKETYEAQKAFAGEKKPSMLHRCVGHDYTGRQIYMITMVTEGRRALFGHVVGKSDAPEGNPDEPHIELSALGQRVADEWWAAPLHHPEVEVIALQMMPDHFTNDARPFARHPLCEGKDGETAWHGTARV